MGRRDKNCDKPVIVCLKKEEKPKCKKKRNLAKLTTEAALQNAMYQFELGNSSSPPDNALAVGPDVIVMLVNELIAIFQKSTLSRFFEEKMLTFFPFGASAGGGDVQALYDPLSERFFVSAWSSTTIGAELIVDPPNPAAGTFDATIAEFGPQTFSVSGSIVAAEPITALPAILNGPALAGNIALIQRGVGAFTAKVKNAQDAGAIGVIVFDDLNEPLISMGGSDPTIVIPSIFISLADGSNLLANLPATGTIQNLAVSTLINAYNIGVSTTSSPRGDSDWFKYQLTLPGWTTRLPDYPKLSVGQNSVYFANQNTGAFQVEVITLDKAKLLDGTGVSVTDARLIDGQEFIWPARLKPPIADTFMPTFFVGTNATDFSGASTALRIYNSADFTSIDVPYPTPMTFGPVFGSNIPQPNGAPAIEVINELMQSVVLDGNSLWCAQVWTPSPNKFITRWYELDVSRFVSNGQITLKQWGDVDPGGATSTSFPAMGVNDEGSMGIGFNIVGPTQTPSIAYTGRLRADPRGTVRMPLKVPILSQYAYGGDTRWGDYSSLALDPVDGKTFYFSGEYPSQLPSDVDPTTNISYVWTTGIVEFSVEPGCPEEPNKPTNAAPSSVPAPAARSAQPARRGFRKTRTAEE